MIENVNLHLVDTLKRDMSIRWTSSFGLSLTLRGLRIGGCWRIFNWLKVEETWN